MNETAKKYSFTLKSCPFCAGKPELHKCPKGPTDSEGNIQGGWYLRCLCDSGEIHAETVWHPSVESAVNAWNARSVSSSDYILTESDCIVDDQEELSVDQLLRQAAGCLVCSSFGVDVCAVHAPDAPEKDTFEELETEYYTGPQGFEHCPFCGDLLTLVTRKRSSIPVSYNFHCQNPECLLSSERMVDTPDFSSKEEIAALWNQRESEAKPVVRF